QLLVDMGIATPKAVIGADLPISFKVGNNNPTKIYDLQFRYDLSTPTVAPTISNGLGSQSLGDAIKGALGNVNICNALGGLSAGFDALFGPLSDGVKNSVLTTNLPLIGGALSSIATFLTDVKGYFDSAWSSVTDTVTQARDLVFQKLGPNGLNLLVPTDP